MKQYNDRHLEVLEKKFFQPMWKNAPPAHAYEYFRDSLFDFERVFIYILYPTHSFMMQRQQVKPGNVCVLRFTANANWELEVCSKSGILSKVVYPTDYDLQRLVKLVQFRQRDFDKQPNPFGDDIRLRHRDPVRR